jgi:hypothetical protein
MARAVADAAWDKKAQGPMSWTCAAVSYADYIVICSQYGSASGGYCRQYRRGPEVCWYPTIGRRRQNDWSMGVDGFCDIDSRLTEAERDVYGLITCLAMRP